MITCLYTVSNRRSENKEENVEKYNHFNMRKVALLIFLFLNSLGLCAQELMKKIYLQEGHVENIQFGDFSLSTLLQVYEEESASHLIGDVYLRVTENDEIIADFYASKEDPGKEYYTKIYQNYLFSFEKENSLLLIEPSDFEKVFAISSKNNGIVGKGGNMVEVKIADSYMESGYDGPPQVIGRKYFMNVHYTLQVKVGDIVQNVSFYSTDIKDGISYNVAGCTIHILSDQYKDSVCFLEMMIEKK